jgi:hypothetical protein
MDGLLRFARNDEETGRDWHTNIPCNFLKSGIGRGFMTGKTVLPGWLTSQESLP